MKTYLTILCILFLFSCHKPSNKEISQKKVENYLIINQKKNNYESILFGELDSAYTSVKDTQLYKEYNQRRGAFEAMEIFSKQFPNMYSEEESKSNKEQERYYQAICDSLESIFSPQFIGWQIQHIYKYKNDKGEFVVDNYIFFLNENLQTITRSEQIYTNLPIETFNHDTTFYGIKNKSPNISV
jgi:hypothetical protein